MIACKLCGVDIRTEGGLIKHIIRGHKKTRDEAYILVGRVCLTCKTKPARNYGTDYCSSECGWEASRQAKIGKPKSDECKAKIRASKAANPYVPTEEHKEAVRKGVSGLKRSPETLAKMSAAQKEIQARPEVKEIKSIKRSKWLSENSSFQQKQPSSNEYLFMSKYDKRSWKYTGCFPEDGSNDRNAKYDLAADYGITADFVNPARLIALWTDGCYTHGCLTCFSDMTEKYASHCVTAERMQTRCEKIGYTAVRIWEHELTDPNLDLEQAIAQVKRRKAA